MRRVLAVLVWVCFVGGAALDQPALAQPAFDVASVRPSKANIGHDGAVSSDPGRLTIRNATLKRLVNEAYQVPYSQINGGPKWFDTQEFDLDAKADGPATLPEMRTMLRKVLVERFGLVVRSETQEQKVYALTVAKGGPKLPGTAGTWRFQGDLAHFAGVLAMQLAIPVVEDPTRVSRVSGRPVPVVDRTGIAGEFHIQLEIRLDPALDAFTMWQRALQDQLGLRLEATRAPVEALFVEQASMPTGN